jgi:hypothetical protein
MTEPLGGEEGTIDPGMLRVNGSDAFKKAIANLIGGLAANAGGNTLSTLAGQQVSLHSADPGKTGASELTGGGYARKPVTWNAAEVEAGTGRGKITGNPIQFDVPAGAIGFYGVWVGGTYLYGKALNPAVTLSAAGKVTITPTHAYGLQ